MVFEAQLVGVLQKYLGTYVHGLSREALSVSVWKGDVELRNLKLRAEALNALDLPISVKAGFLGSITLKVPWSRLGQEPVIVLLDRIFLIAEPYTGGTRAQPNPDEEAVPAVFESKRRRIEETELQYLKKKGKKDAEMQNSGWLQGLISTIVGNLKFSVTNVHVRYEDATSNPGHPFCLGFTLGKLAAVTVDEEGKETFATSNALERLRKSVELSRLAVYHNPDCEAFRVRKAWDELKPDDWSAIFERGIQDDESLATPVEVLEGGESGEENPSPRHYLLCPVSLGARYSKLSSEEIQRKPEVPLHQADATLEDVTLTLEQDQFRDMMKLLESFQKYNKLQTVQHLRPRKSVRQDPRAWWRFAVKALREQELRHRPHLDWQEVVHLSQLRRQYVPLYARLLMSAQPGQNVGDNTEIKAMDRELPVETAALWRIIAHKQADDVARKRAREEAERRAEAAKHSWWSYLGFGGGGSKGSGVDRPETLSEEEWASIQKLVGFDEAGAANMASLTDREAPNMLQVALNVTFRRSQIRLMGQGEDEDLLRLGSEGFLVGTRIYPQAKVVRIGLERYGVIVPEGSLLQSVLRRDAQEAVSLEFVLAPFDRSDVDWALAATCAPAHITIWRKSVDRVLRFFQAGKAASPGALQDTTAVLQVKLEEARKSAAQQLQAAMKEKPRFSIDLDLDAPKVAIPTSYAAGGAGNTQLLVDLGHFNIRTDDDTKPCDLTKEELDLYTRFQLNASDISVFFADGDWDWEKRALIGKDQEQQNEQKTAEENESSPAIKRPDQAGPRFGVLSLLDNTGLTVALHQIFMPHPRYPTTRIALRVPLLGFHFSPARYHRIMAVVDAVLPKSEPEQMLDERNERGEVARPWGPTDMEGPVQVLTWEGLARTQATWKPSWALLAGVYLYLLESKDANSYLHYSSLIGKNIRDVPPEKIRGCEHVVAVMDQGASMDSIAQATNALVLRFDSEAKKSQWKQAMQGSLYRASAPAALTILSSESSSDAGSSVDEESQPGEEHVPQSTPEAHIVEAAKTDSSANEELNPAVQQNILMVGELDVLRVDVDGVRNGDQEFPLLQVRASGTKVELVQRMYDVAVGMVLQSVEIEDLFHGHTAPECKFLARSFLAAREDLDRTKSEEAEALKKLEKEANFASVDDELSSSGKERGKADTKQDEHWKERRKEAAKGSGKPGKSQANTTNGASPQSPREASPERLDGDDFYDAASTLSRSGSAGSRSSQSPKAFRTVSSHGSVYFDAPEGSLEASRGLSMLPPSFKQSGILELEETEAGQGTGAKGNTFVRVVAIMRQTQSPDYKGVDTKVVLDMATLDFFLNRPTVLALIDFGQHITQPPEEASTSDAKEKGKQKEDEGTSTEASVHEGSGSKAQTENGTVVSKVEPEALDEVTTTEQPAVLSGLLGYGKSRVVLGLEVRMQRVQVVLNQDQGGMPLAVLAMLDLANEVKVFPSSFLIKAGLGSLRICDSRLGEEHPYGQMFGMQKQQGGSFVMMQFESYDPGEDEYSGYDYSLCVRLASMRTVILYRFIQELTAYFMDLVPSGGLVQTEQLRATVEGVEQWIQQSDLHGQPAISLDVQMDRPLILMPESSDSKEYIEMDIERIALSNESQWKGGSEEDIAAVRLDIITLSIQGLGLRVGNEKGVGHEIVEEASGLQVTAVRPLRDVLKQVPTVDVTVAIDRLKAGMASSEYQVVSRVVITNMGEEAHLPPKLKQEADQDAGTSESRSSGTHLGQNGQENGTLAAAKVEDDGQILQEVEGGVGASGEPGEVEKKAGQPWASLRLTLDVRKVEAELYTSVDRESSLALVQTEGLWASYRMTPNDVSVVNATLLRLNLLDQRDSTEESMRYLLGSTVEFDPGHPLHSTSEEGDKPLLTLLVLDAQISPDSYTISVRLQRPRVLVVVDFLLAVAQFFIPHMAMLPGAGTADEGKAHYLDPLGTQNDLQLKGGVFEQPDDTLELSPGRQLVADCPGKDEYVYDGKGGTLVLTDQFGNVLHAPPTTPLIIVGPGKQLRFRNVTIKGAAFLDWSVQLGACSSYSVEEADGVVLEASPKAVAQAHEVPRSEQRLTKKAKTTAEEEQQAAQKQAPPVKMLVHAQIHAPELTFYDSTPWPSKTPVRPERLLRVKMDAHATLSMRGNDMWARGLINGLTMEASNGVSVVEPVTATAEITTTDGKQLLTVNMSPMAVHLSFTTMRLLLRLQSDILDTLQLTSNQFTVKCTQFDRIWLGRGNEDLPSSRPLSIWRARVPPGYASLGDCLVTGSGPPSQAVLALSTAFSRTRKPLRLERVYTSPDPPSEESPTEDSRDCYTVWRPVAPPGYVSLGHVVEKGTEPPPSGIIWCARKDLVSSAAVGDCLFTQAESNGKAPLSLWHIENGAQSFLLLNTPGPAPFHLAYDLRDMLRFTGTGHTAAPPVAPPPGGGAGLSRLPSRKAAYGKMSPLPSLEGEEEAEDDAGPARKVYQPVAELRRVWWSKGIPGSKPVSIWRPVAPEGSAILGDVAVPGFEPPAQGLAVLEHADRWACPDSFEQIVVYPHPRSTNAVTLWWPQAPDGFTAVGCVASAGTQPPATSLVRCVRRDLLRPAGYASPPIWDTQGLKSVPSLTLWRVHNEMNTFVAGVEDDPPPSHKTFALKDLTPDRPPDTLALEAKLGPLTVTLYDDFGGLMTPLLEMGLRTTSVAVHGRPEMLNAMVATAVAASTFNPRLDVWEPVMEPWEAIMRCEYINDPSELALPGVTRLRLSSNSTVNVNASSTTISTLVDAAVAYNKVTQLEEEARKEGQKRVLEKGPKLTLGRSAMDQRSQATIKVQNQLGRDMWLRVVDSSSEESTEQIIALPVGQENTIDIPPPQTLRKTDSSRKSALLPSDQNGLKELQPRARRFAAVRIGEAQGLPPSSNVNTQEFLCALRLVADQFSSVGSPSQSPGLPRPFTELLERQSARTRCVKGNPSNKGSDDLSAMWEEVFVFEVPLGGQASVDIVATNQGANGGRGAVVGHVSVPAVELTAENVAGSHSIFNPKWHPLKGEKGEENGRISIAVHVFDLDGGHAEGKKLGKASFKKKNKGKPIEAGVDATGIQLGLGEDGPWAPLRSVIPVGAFVRTIGGMQMVVQVDLAEGTKHILLRSLVVLVNDSTVALEVSAVPRALRDKDESGRARDNRNDDNVTGPLEVEQEIFENERYLPCVGWGSSWPGHFLPSDPGRWTSQNDRVSEMDFKEPALPPGWEWAGDWQLDTSGNVDYEGWAYAVNFFSLRKWPPSPRHKFKRSMDFVRRRRWVRVRRRVLTGASGRIGLGVLKPEEKLPLPWMAVDPSKDMCLQVRPLLGANSEQPSHSWALPAEEVEHEEFSVIPGRPFGLMDSPKKHKRVSPSEFVLRSLGETTQVLQSEMIGEQDTAVPSKVWLCMAAHAQELKQWNTGQDVVSDWTLRVSPVLTIENKLPMGGHFKVYEKPPRAAMEARQEGDLESGAQAGVVAADVGRPIFLSWETDGWQMNKDAVLISHPDKPPEHSLTLTCPDSNRHLRLGLDFQPSDGELPRVVRIYAPFWLQVRPGLALSVQIVKVSGSVAGRKGRDHWIGQAISRVNIAKRIADKKESKEQANNRQVAAADVVTFSRVSKVLEEVGDVAPSEPVLLSRAADEKAGLRVQLSGTDGEYEHALALAELEAHSADRVEMMARGNDGSYMNVMVSICTCPLSIDATKVIQFQPHTLLSNQYGEDLIFRQAGTEKEQTLPVEADAIPLLWMSTDHPEQLQVRLGSQPWSRPFRTDEDGTFDVLMGDLSPPLLPRVLRVEVRTVVDEARFLVTFRRPSIHPPYRIENRSERYVLEFRQGGLADAAAWVELPPHSATAFVWEDRLQEEKRLEVRARVSGQLGSMGQYDLSRLGKMPSISVPADSQRERASQLEAFLYVEGQERVLRFMVPGEDRQVVTRNSGAGKVGELASDWVGAAPEEALGSTQASSSLLDISLDVPDLGLSVVDDVPQELLYAHAAGLQLGYTTGLGKGVMRARLQLRHFQIDNQLPWSPLPVLLAPEEDKHAGAMAHHVLQATLIIKEEPSHAAQEYPYIGLHTPDIAWRLNLHEPIIWRLLALYEGLGLDRLGGPPGQDQPVAVDPYVGVVLLDMSEHRIKLTTEMAPGQRPPGALGVWGPLITALGNTNAMHLVFHAVVRENLYMRRSEFINTMIAHVVRDLLSQPLRLLSGVDVLGNTSSTLGQAGRILADVSMDRVYIRRRNRAERMSNVEGLGSGLKEGARALGRALSRGIYGGFARPVQGAARDGLEGFGQGCLQGLIGCCLLPASGFLDLASKTTDGIDATWVRLWTDSKANQRARLPRAFTADGVLRPYDEEKARGQAALQTAQMKHKVALADFYEDHFWLVKQRVLVLTNQRMLLLQSDTVLWTVRWDEYLALEATSGDNESGPTRIIVHLKRWQHSRSIFESKALMRSIRCRPGEPPQALRVYAAIKRAYAKYAPAEKAAVTGISHRKRSLYRAGKSGLRMIPDLDKDAQAEVRGRQWEDATWHRVEHFELVWWNKDAHDASASGTTESCLPCCGGPAALALSSGPVAIWRPVAPSGYVTLGHVLTREFDPPASVPAYRADYDQEKPLFAAPVDYDLVYRDTGTPGFAPLTLWAPRAPDGYVTGGDVAVAGWEAPPKDFATCLLKSEAEPVSLATDDPVWHVSKELLSLWPCNIWETNSPAKTFIAHRGQDKPSSTRVYKLRERD